jgi:hypothetical protein
MGQKKGSKKSKAKTEEKVLVHSCFDIEMGDPLPSMCWCRTQVSLKSARSLVAKNKAEWVRGGGTTDHRSICLIEGMNVDTPRSATIDDKHIYRAYVEGDKQEQNRINDYGWMNAHMLRSLTRTVSEKEFKKYREDWGRQFLPD